jgi:hypothetical protein
MSTLAPSLRRRRRDACAQQLEQTLLHSDSDLLPSAQETHARSGRGRSAGRNSGRNWRKRRDSRSAVTIGSRAAPGDPMIPICADISGPLTIRSHFTSDPSRQGSPLEHVQQDRRGLREEGRFPSPFLRLRCLPSPNVTDEVREEVVNRSFWPASLHVLCRAEAERAAAPYPPGYTLSRRSYAEACTWARMNRHAHPLAAFVHSAKQRSHGASSRFSGSFVTTSL